MEKNTIEEKLVDVLSECAKLCPNEGDKINILGDAALLSNCGDSVWKLDWKYMDGKIWLCAETSDWLVDVVYCILGLSERDAVAESENECTKRVWAKDDMANHLLTKITELQDRNTALVEALETLKKAVGYKPKPSGEIISYRNDLGIFIDDVIAANTEKGGANDN